MPRKDDRRLHPPEPFKPYEGLYYVQSYGNACPQQPLTLPNGLGSELVNDINLVVAGLYDALRPTDEDCECHVCASPQASELNDYSRGLTVNVVTPFDATPKSMLPVVVVGIFALTKFL